MNLIPMAMACCCSILMIGCADPNDEAGARKAILELLKDPDSVKYGKFTLVHRNYACLDANYKNTFGGYVGMHAFHLYRNDHNPEWYAGRNVVEGLTHEDCIANQ